MILSIVSVMLICGFMVFFIRFGQKNSGNLPPLPLTSESVLGFVRVPWILLLTSFEEVLHVSCVVADYPWADTRRFEVTARLTAF